MEAVDVELEINSSGAGTYLVAARSPSGEATATMRMPFDEEEIESRLRALQTTLIWSTAKTRRVISEAEKPIRDFGAALFENAPVKKQELTPAENELLTQMLEGVVTSGTGKAAQLPDN